MVGLTKMSRNKSKKRSWVSLKRKALPTRLLKKPADFIRVQREGIPAAAIVKDGVVWRGHPELDKARA